MRLPYLFLLLTFSALPVKGDDSALPRGGHRAKNEFTIAASDDRLLSIRPPVPPRPIFWQATTKMSRGIMLRYTRLVYNTTEHLSLHLGLSVSRWVWRQTPVFAVSALGIVRLWAFSNPNLGAYLSYSIAGPSALSTQFIGQTNLGARFIFQDMIGIGVRVGDAVAWSLEANVAHYSNGNIFPVNSGFDVPFLVSLSAAF